MSEPITLEFLMRENANLHREIGELKASLSVAQQATRCALCGVFKHTPVRIDELGGYICAGCLEKKYIQAVREKAGSALDKASAGGA